jgi:hypothetical protein
LAKPDVRRKRSRAQSHRPANTSTGNLYVANPTIAVISSIAPAFVQSVFFVAAWDTSTKKKERQINLAFKISFFREWLISGKLSAEIFFASAAHMVQVQ